MKLNGNFVVHHNPMKLITRIAAVTILTLTLGCTSRYLTEYDQYRPKKAKFTIGSNSSNLARFDSIPFVIIKAYNTYTLNYDSLWYHDIMLFSDDGRFSSSGSLQNERRQIVEIDRKPWISSETVGFYQLFNDTIMVEYFTNFQGGQYHTFMGSIENNGDLKIFKYYQGVGRFKVQINRVHRNKLSEIPLSQIYLISQ